MRIRKLTVEAFGKFKERSFLLEDGINVVVGPNESGKSTLARFIRFMLYGFGTSRKTDLAENDKLRYTPWDETAARGEMILDGDGGERLTVLREAGKKQNASVTDAYGVPVFEGLVPGEAILGVSAGVYDKTALISAGDVRFGDPAALETAIKNAVSAADLEVNVDAALAALDKTRTALLGKTARSGRLYDARKELAALKERRALLAERHKELLAAESSLAAVRVNIAEKEAALEKVTAEENNLLCKKAAETLSLIEEAEKAASDAKTAHENRLLAMTVGDFLPDKNHFQALDDARNGLLAAEAAVTKARAEFDASREALKDRFRDDGQMRFNKDLDDTGRTVKEVSDSLETLSREIDKHEKAARHCLYFFFFLLPLLFWRKHKNKAAKLREEREKLLAAFRASDADTLRRYLADYAGSSEAVAAVRKRVSLAKDALDEAVAARGKAAQTLCDLLEKSGLAAAYTDFSDLADRAAVHIRALDEALREAESLSRARGIAEARLEALLQTVGDRETLRGRAAAYDPALPLRDEAVIAREKRFYVMSLEGLRKKEHEYETRAAVITSGMEKPDELAAAEGLLTEKTDRMAIAVEALDEAAEALRKAESEMRDDVSPRLTSDASALFAELTDGRYKGLYVSPTLSLSFLETGSAAYRHAAYLSTGALDAAYLCTRLVLIRYLYGQRPVLLFDDAFSHFDDERLARVCGMLKRLSADYQILLFTCQDREKALLHDAANVITLS